MTDREKVVEGLEMSCTYSNVDEGNTLVPQQLVLDAIALLKAQGPVSIEERLVLDKLHTIQDYARVNEIHWMADGAAFAENVMNMLRGEINQFRKAQEPRVMTLGEAKSAYVVEYRSGKMREIGSALLDLNVDPLNAEYGKIYRVWTSRPTDEQREATPWE